MLWVVLVCLWTYRFYSNGWNKCRWGLLWHLMHPAWMSCDGGMSSMGREETGKSQVLDLLCNPWKGVVMCFQFAAVNFESLPSLVMTFCFACPPGCMCPVTMVRGRLNESFAGILGFTMAWSYVKMQIHIQQHSKSRKKTAWRDHKLTICTVYPHPSILGSCKWHHMCRCIWLNTAAGDCNDSLFRPEVVGVVHDW